MHSEDTVETISRMWTWYTTRGWPLNKHSSRFIPKQINVQIALPSWSSALDQTEGVGVDVGVDNDVDVGELIALSLMHD